MIKTKTGKLTATGMLLALGILLPFATSHGMGLPGTVLLPMHIPVLLCVLNGSIMFTAELMKRLRFNCQIVSTKLTSYVGTETTGEVKQALGLTADITGRRVIVVEDIVDSGNTIVALKKILAEKGAKEARMCTLLLKPEAYKKDVVLDYVAMEIPNDFIVGFGLDYDEIGRNLKDIYILDTEAE